MRHSETAITITALALGIIITLLLNVGPLSLVYLSKLLVTGKAPVGKMLFVFSFTLGSSLILGWMLRSWLKTIKHTHPLFEVKKSNAFISRQNAKEKLLELAQHAVFDIATAIKTTALSRVEIEYLLEELLAENSLEVFEEHGLFYYGLTKMP
jgi:hypothetical protein